MIWCVVPAAGRGQRFGTVLPKQYAPLVGEPMLVRTLDRLAAHPRIGGLMVALAKDDPHWPGLEEIDGTPVRTCIGGEERRDSVLAALDALADSVGDDDFVLVHDAARPCIRLTDLDALLIAGLASEHGAILAAPVRDTIKRGHDGVIVDTVPRGDLWRALTPQLFRFGPLRQALRQAQDQALEVTDEASAMEQAGLRPLLVAGSDDNLKVTTLGDLALAEFILTHAI